jgi:hypothetical protein
LVNGETVGSVTLASVGQAATAGVVGSPYAIEASNATGGIFTASNYSITYVNGALTVTPAPLAITAQDVSKVYGQTPALTGFDASALVNGETVGSVTLASVGQAATAGVVGSPYAIEASNATGGTFTPSNYSISYVNGVLTVTPAPLTITAQDVSKVYGQASVLNGFEADALVNGETVGFVSMSSEGQSELSSVEGSPYAIVPSNAGGGSFTASNYSISYVSGVLTVIPIAPPIELPDVPPVVVPPVIVEPVPPPVAPSIPAGSGLVVPLVSSDTQALPHLPLSDAPLAPLVVLPLANLVQGPVTPAAPVKPEIVFAPSPSTTPAIAPVSPSTPAAMPTPLAEPRDVAEDEKPFVLAPIRRPLKQDRN